MAVVAVGASISSAVAAGRRFIHAAHSPLLFGGVVIVLVYVSQALQAIAVTAFKWLQSPMYWHRYKVPLDSAVYLGYIASTTATEFQVGKSFYNTGALTAHSSNTLTDA